MSTREERKARKAERMQRDRENKSLAGGLYALGKNGLEFDFFNAREKEGRDIHLDVIPYIIKSDRHPEVRAGNMQVGDEDYILEYWRHSGLGPEKKWHAVCPRNTFNQPCPICEMIENSGISMRDHDSKPKLRVLYNVIDKKGDPNKIMIFDVSNYLFHKELKDKLSRYDGGWFDFSDPQEGKTVKCYCYHDGQNTKGGFTAFKEFDFVNRQPYPESIIDRAYPLEQVLNVLSYDELRKKLYEVEEPVHNHGGGTPGGQQYTGYQGNSGNQYVGYQGNSGGQQYAGYQPPVQQHTQPPIQQPPVQPSVQPQNVNQFEQQQRSPGMTTDLKVGDACPYGLVFGVDINNPEHNKKICGLKCDDKTWQLCSHASKRETQSSPI